jgi:hypothetical protein
MDIASLADLLHETAEHHDPYEKSHAPTTGGTGTPPTLTRDSVATHRMTQPRPPAATWRKSSTCVRCEISRGLASGPARALVTPGS